MARKDSLAYQVLVKIIEDAGNIMASKAFEKATKKELRLVTLSAQSFREQLIEVTKTPNSSPLDEKIHKEKKRRKTS